MHTVFNPVVHCRYMLPTIYLSIADIAKPDLLACCSWTWISRDISAIMRYSASHPASPHGWACPKRLIGHPIARGRRCRHNLTIGLLDRCDSSTASNMYCLEPSHSFPTFAPLLTPHFIHPPSHPNPIRLIPLFVLRKLTLPVKASMTRLSGVIQSVSNISQLL